MSDGVRIKLSAGLLVVALLHAVAIVGLFEAVHRSPRAPEQPLPWNVPVQRTPEPSIGKLTEPAIVNLHAQGEVKQQCIDCTPTYVRPAPGSCGRHRLTFSLRQPSCFPHRPTCSQHRFRQLPCRASWCNLPL